MAPRAWAESAWTRKLAGSNNTPMATGWRVLVVEDEEGARKPIEDVLRLMGFNVRTAGTLAGALEQLDGQECLLLDIHLPDGMGTTVLRKIRSEERPIRVAVLTGTSQPHIDRELERLGLSDNGIMRVRRVSPETGSPPPAPPRRLFLLAW